MSIQAVAWALEQDLPARPKLVLVAIANHANHVDGYCWLKAETIAREGACSQRAVFNYVGALIRNGYIRKEPRKGEDGKQRASDYWILFNRPAVEWKHGHDEAQEHDEGHGAEQETEGEAAPETSEPPVDAAQDVVQPHAQRACGETAENPGEPPVDKPAGASGPHAHACIRYSDEPSKTNPSPTSGESERPFAGPPRGYAPPPMGSKPKEPGKPVFVFEGTPAWDAWVAEKRRSTGRNWTLTTVHTIDGRARRGWFFGTTLFPPAAGATGPPKGA